MFIGGSFIESLKNRPLSPDFRVVGAPRLVTYVIVWRIWA